MGNAESEIEGLFKEWADTEVRVDVDSWLEYLSDDIVLQPPGEPAVHGKQDCREWFVKFFQAPVSAMEPLSTNILVSDSNDLAASFGDLRVVFDNPDGALELKMLAVTFQLAPIFFQMTIDFTAGAQTNLSSQADRQKRDHGCWQFSV